jgi:FtsP/CotA-like multicopper oxidase with cupredoxin domain
MFQDPLPLHFDVLHPTGAHHRYTIQIEARRARLTGAVTPAHKNAWCYLRVEAPRAPGAAPLDNYLGPVIDVEARQHVVVTWVNTLGGMPGMPMQDMPPINPLPMDGSIPDFDAMNWSVGVVTHLHGAKVSPASDGWPVSPLGYRSRHTPYSFPHQLQYVYPNDQRAAMLWFHDHAMDNTSPQVQAGLAGLYFIRDDFDRKIAALAPGGEIPLVLQDRVIPCGYQSIDYTGGVPLQPDATDAAKLAFARPEFLGETIFVNGRPTPFHEFARKTHRLRVLNGSNARTYALALVDPAGWLRPAHNYAEHKRARKWRSDLLTIVGNDGGLISKSVQIASTGYVLIAPGERLDLLLDLTDPTLAGVEELRLVNLALGSLDGLGTDATTGLDDTSWAEAIFQTVEPITDGKSNAGSSLLSLPTSDCDVSLRSALQFSQAAILQLCLAPEPATAPLERKALDAALAAAAPGDDFAYVNGALVAKPENGGVAANRFLLLMNNTTGAAGDSPATGQPWKDTQIWELAEADDETPPRMWEAPFVVDLSSPASPSDAQDRTKSYRVARSTFFDPKTFKLVEADPVGYPPPAQPTFTPTEGSYERWYVANIGNGAPGTAIEADGTIPDMHPFHMHLVSFVVTRRWRLDPTTRQFVRSAPRDGDLDGVARHDTVRVQSNELLELLVWFPKGYTGDYPYHCHIVEHEDMGMMLHFQVQPAGGKVAA